MVIQQGDVFWIHMGDAKGHALAYRHPHVVIQGNPYNQSKIRTVVVCGITSKLQRADLPGNVLLKKGEANLLKDSVVNISQLFTVDKDVLVEKIGALSAERLEHILVGINLLFDFDR